jgi:hypothetical protein
MLKTRKKTREIFGIFWKILEIFGNFWNSCHEAYENMNFLDADSADDAEIN